DGFTPEGRLNGFTIDAQVAPELSSSGLNDHELFAGLAAAVLAVLAFFEDAAHRAIVIRVRAMDGTLMIDIVATVPGDAPAANHFFDLVAIRPGGCAAAVCALAARALAQRYGGTATFEAMPPEGHALRLTLVRRS